MGDQCGTEETWKTTTLLENNISTGVRLFIERLHLKTDVPEDDPCYCEKLCRAIIDAIQRLDEAWVGGQFTSHLLPCQLTEDIMHFEMNRSQLVVREQANGIIRVWNRHNLELEAELMGVASGNVQNFGLYKNIVVCGGSDGTIQVWDIDKSTGQNSLAAGRVENLCLKVWPWNSGGLVVHPKCEFQDGKFTFWRVPTNLTGIWMGHEIPEPQIHRVTACVADP